MQPVMQVPLGVVMVRERVEGPWEDHIWRVDSVFLHAPAISAWRELHRTAQSVQYHAATLPMELHRKDTAGYLANLEGERPSVYVVWRHDAYAADNPVSVALVIASAHEAEAYGQIEEEKVGAVAMPAPLVELVAAFIDAHHEDEVFVKRQRVRHHREEDHAFGQEPLAELRRRMAARGPRREDDNGK